MNNNGTGSNGDSPESGAEDFLAGQSRFERRRFINRGGYGFVLHALDRSTGREVALKFIERKEGKITKYVEREILNHTRLRHPHIIELKEVFLTDAHLVLVLEYAPGGDLFQFVARCKVLPEGDARWFLRQILLATDYCHKMGVANRDIKLENCLLMDSSVRPVVKLADFGFSKDENHHSAPGSRVGTPAYLAPEVISAGMGRSYDAKKSDVWSTGVSLYAMVIGGLPFKRTEDEQQPAGKGLQAMMQRILKSDYTFPESRPLSAMCKDLISGMLRADPLQRLSVDQVLQHPWCCQEMPPQLLTFNDAIVATSRANPPPVEKLEAIKLMLAEVVATAAAPKRRSEHVINPPQGCRCTADIIYSDDAVAEMVDKDWDEFDYVNSL